MAAIRDVAKAANVSISTVSHALNGTAPISAAVRARVLAAAEALNYQPSQAARTLVTGKSSVIGLLVGNVANPYFPEIIHGIEAVLSGEGYHVFLSNTNDDLKKNDRIIDALIGQRVAGILLMIREFEGAPLQRLLAHGVPVVLRDPPPMPAPEHVAVVEIAYADGIVAAIRHLAALGHTRIAHVTGPMTTRGGPERLAMFRQALEAASLPFIPDLIQGGNYRVEGGRAAGHTLLQRADPPTAIFAANDSTALGVLQAARERGVRVPDDLSLVGLDDVPVASLVTPPLTTVALPLAEIGTIAARALVAMIRGESTERKICIDGHLVVRESTGPVTARAHGWLRGGMA